MGEKLIAAIRSTPISTPAASLEITASAGAARREHSHTTADALIDSADRALYAAKHRGRDRVVLDVEIQPEEIARIEPEVIRLAEGLALAASIREGQTPLHSKRVADLAAMIARELALNEPTPAPLPPGGLAPRHRQIGDTDHILASSSDLGDHEQQILRRHAEVGAAIVSGIASLADAAPGVRHHHERYDGTGYPDGLRVDAIPLEARIVAAADTYSASLRPANQPALSHDDALERLQELSGLSLDPTIVAALARSLAAHPEAQPDCPRASRRRSRWPHDDLASSRAQVTLRPAIPLRRGPRALDSRPIATICAVAHVMPDTCRWRSVRTRTGWNRE